MDTNATGIQIDFSSLNGAQTVEHTVTTEWLVTGVANGIDMGRMSISSERRDFAPGISGRHTAEKPSVCFLELDVKPESPPPFSYLLTVEAPLKEFDIRPAGDAPFSGNYYNADETISQIIVEQNRAFLESGHYNGLIRYSAAALAKLDTKETVHALLPSAIGKFTIKKIEPLGTGSPPVEIRWPDGRTESSTKYYPA
jgi:hypothetical protein